VVCEANAMTMEIGREFDKIQQAIREK